MALENVQSTVAHVKIHHSNHATEATRASFTAIDDSAWHSIARILSQPCILQINLLICTVSIYLLLIKQSIMHLIHAYKLVCTFWHVLFVFPNEPMSVGMLLLRVWVCKRVQVCKCEGRCAVITTPIKEHWSVIWSCPKTFVKANWSVWLRLHQVH